MRTGQKTLVWSMVAVLVAALAVAGCGSKKKSEAASSFEVTITQSGKQAKYAVPASVTGGLTRVRLLNHGKTPHAAQLIRIEGNHSAAEVLKIIAGNSDKTPEWLRAEGGVGGTGPGSVGQATVVLPAGKYIVADEGGPGSSGPPGYAEFTVTAGKSGSLPSASTSVTAANPSKDRYKWQISGTALKSGENTLTFHSKGKEAIHLINAVRITGNHTNAEVIKAFSGNQKPPSWIDFSTSSSSAVLDGGKSEVTTFSIRTPGRYVLFCPLPDRDGGKPHVAEGLITQLTIK